jgi:uncharacterized RDD family membrane protein YckC
MPSNDFEYAGFWVRVGAALIDTVMVLVVTSPLLVAIYGWSYYGSGSGGLFAGYADFMISFVAPIVATILFWLLRQATPGKMMLALKVVDARTGGTLSVSQSIVRYIGYFVSTIPLGLGLIWVGLDPRKQGWHDKMAGSVVLRSKDRGTLPVQFEQS